MDAERESTMEESPALSAARVDPRDVNWEDLHPVFRVYFTEADGSTDEWRISQAGSVEKVLTWAERESDARAQTIYVEVRGAMETGLVCIAHKPGAR
ncbi:MAG: hypothetical protein QM708_07000 [Propioniciclava sp.]|uniref:hypothetical protein n=1 Tax=Propioniciclava sp. TaxID=2038686 RepID=UPI0039E509CE